MVAGHLREKRGIYHMILSYTNENGERVTPTKSTGLPVKGNKKRAEAMLNDWRKSEEIALKKRKANGSLKKLDPNQEILFTKFMLDWLEMMKNSVMEEVRRIFKPEFLNRIDETIVFRALNKDDMKQIVALLCKDLQKRCLDQMDITLNIRDSVRTYIVEKAYDRKYGARPLKRKLQSEVEDRLAEEIVSGNIKPNDRVSVTVKNDEIAIIKK